MIADYIRLLEEYFLVSQRIEDKEYSPEALPDAQKAKLRDLTENIIEYQNNSIIATRILTYTGPRVIIEREIDIREVKVRKVLPDYIIEEELILSQSLNKED